MPRGPKPAEPIALTLEELKQLQHLVRLREAASHGRVVRAQMLLAAYEHPEWNNAQIARQLGTTVGNPEAFQIVPPNWSRAGTFGTPPVFLMLVLTILLRPANEHRAPSD